MAPSSEPLRAPLDHVKNVTSRDRIFSQPVALFETPEQRSLFVLTNAGRCNPVM
jgi:hypothetical protein